jgi:transcriptional regulator
MYLPKHFAQTDIAELHALIEKNPLATLITHDSDGLCANHIPVHLSKETPPYGLLSGHIPRANPLARDITGRETTGLEGLMIFHGVNAYISPSWYASKTAHGKVVPTWNYTAVHARGKIRFIDDAEWVLQHLTKFTGKLESSLPNPWSVSDAPSDFIENLLPYLIGFEMTIEMLEGKWKLSQNRSVTDRESVARGLQTVGTAHALAMAEIIRKQTI